MEEKYTPDNSRTISLRLPNDLFDQIRLLCEKSERNTSEQIRYMLRKYLEIQQ